MRIVKSLKFDIRYDSPLFFLERFIHIFELDVMYGKDFTRIEEWARKFCRHTLSSAEFLEFRPSQVSAGCLLMAIKIDYELSIISDTTYDHSSHQDIRANPYQMWNNTLEGLT